MLKKSFIEAHVSNGGREDIVTFIANVRFAEGQKGQDIIRRLFRRGYCYYFACMLREAYPGGRIMCIPKSGHVLYEYEGILYDIEGVYELEHEEISEISGHNSAVDIQGYLHK